jgi:hypothetical protein
MKFVWHRLGNKTLDFDGYFFCTAFGGEDIFGGEVYFVIDTSVADFVGVGSMGINPLP